MVIPNGIRNLVELGNNIYIFIYCLVTRNYRSVNNKGYIQGHRRGYAQLVLGSPVLRLQKDRDSTGLRPIRTKIPKTDQDRNCGLVPWSTSISRLIKTSYSQPQ